MYYLNIILDFIVILILIMFWISGFKKGMIKSLLYLTGTAISISMISISAKYISAVIFDYFIKQNLINLIKKIIVDNNGLVKPDMNQFPWILQLILGSRGIGNNNIINLILGRDDPVIKIINLITPNILSLLSIGSSVIIYTIVMSSIKILTKSISKLFNFTRLSVINHFLGGIFGICKGFCILWIFMFLLKLSLPTFSIKPEIFSENTINSSIVFKNIYYFKIDFYKIKNIRLLS